MSKAKTFKTVAKSTAPKLVALIQEIAAREKKTVEYVVECLEVVGPEWLVPDSANKGEPGFSVRDMSREVLREAKLLLGIHDN